MADPIDSCPEGEDQREEHHEADCAAQLRPYWTILLQGCPVYYQVGDVCTKHSEDHHRGTSCNRVLATYYR